MKISLHFVSLKLRRVAARCKVQFHMWKITLEIQQKKNGEKGGAQKYNRGSTCHTAQYVCAVEMDGGLGGCGMKMLEKQGGLTDGSDTRVENKWMQREKQRVPERKSAPRWMECQGKRMSSQVKHYSDTTKDRNRLSHITPKCLKGEESRYFEYYSNLQAMPSFHCQGCFEKCSNNAAKMK